MIQRQAIVIGAGAAGLMCARTLGQRGFSPLVLDHANKAGKKILMSGGGRCNFTNYYTGPEHFISHNPHFCKSALSRFTPYDFLELIYQHDIPFVEKGEGQLFCENSAKDIQQMLLKEVSDAGGEVQLKVDILQIEKTEGGFVLETSKGTFLTPNLVIATGGLSIPTLGATGFGYQLAKQFGLKVYEQTAGLVPFRFTGSELEVMQSLSGLSLPASVTTNNQTFNEAVLFTHRGLSGPSVLQTSSFWQPSTPIYVDWSPQLELGDYLRTERSNGCKQQVKNLLNPHFPSRFLAEWRQLLPEVQVLLEKSVADLSNEAIDALANAFHRHALMPSGTEGYRTAEVTLGGVDTDEVSSKTFESKQVAGLYFIGEVLDVTGFLGGHNFQWAWASGVAAGKSISV